MRKNILFAQSGGPTAVINASCFGIIDEGRKLGGRIFAGKHGVEGILKDNLIEVTNVSDERLEMLRYSPSAAFGSCRHKLKESEFEAAVAIFDKYDIGYFFYIGGNDSMDTADRLSHYVEKLGKDIKVVGVPKTVDNDLVNTHFCPGFGSAAKYIATSVREMALDVEVYDKNSVTIVEVMGRDSGFLAAASALARCDAVDAPHLIYMPEEVLDEEEFIEDVRRVYEKRGKVFVVASEGLKDKNGEYAHGREKVTDSFGHCQMGGVGRYLESLVNTHIEKRTKVIELSTLQRSASHAASLIDNEVAVMVGRAGVHYAMEGGTDIMVSIKYDGEDFSVEATPLSEVANKVKFVPQEWIDKKNRWVTQAAIDYITPLIQGQVIMPYGKGLPKYTRFI